MDKAHVTGKTDIPFWVCLGRVFHQILLHAYADLGETDSERSAGLYFENGASKMNWAAWAQKNCSGCRWGVRLPHSLWKWGCTSADIPSWDDKDAKTFVCDVRVERKHPLGDTVFSAPQKSSFNIMGMQIVLSDDMRIDRIEVVTRDGYKIEVVNIGSGDDWHPIAGTV